MEDTINAFVEYTDTFNEAIAYNIILNQSILALLTTEEQYSIINKRAIKKAKNLYKDTKREQFKKELLERLKK